MKELKSESETIFYHNFNKLSNVPLFYKGERDEKLLEDIKNNKVVIYTAFTGDYDNLKDPKFIDENCDYICFTDNDEASSDIWKIIPIKESNLDNNRIAKQFKILPHRYLSDYEYSFWLDGSFEIRGSIREYIYKYLKNPMLNVSHDERDCIYDETIVSAGLPRYPTETLIKQSEDYRKQGLPSHYGLPSAGAIFRKHNDSMVMKVMEDWWSENLKYTNQDQISFTYVCWKNDFHPSVSDVYYWNNKYWTKGEGYHHKIVLKNALTSYNLIENIESKQLSISDLAPSEIQLLYNDLTNLIFEEENPMEFLHVRLVVYHDGKETTLIKGCHREEINSLKFDLGLFKDIKKLAFLPSPTGHIECKIISIDSDADDIKVTKFNSLNNHSEDVQLFGNVKPRYEIKGDFSDASYFEINFNISPISNNNLEKRIKKLYNSEKKKNKEIKKLKNKNKKILNSTSWKITKPMRSLTNLFKNHNLK